MPPKKRARAPISTTLESGDNEPKTIKAESGQQRFVDSIATLVPMVSFSDEGELSLQTMKQIYDEDNANGKKRKRGSGKEEKSTLAPATTTNSKKRPKKKLSIAQAARQQLLAAPIDQSSQQQQTQLDVANSDEFLQMLRALGSTYPVYHTSLDQLHRGESTPSMLQEVLRTPRPVLEVRTAELESKMLKQAGVFYDHEAGREVNFPRCDRGSYCMTSALWQSVGLEGLDEPVVLMASMSASQYSELLRKGRAPPDFRAMCVLCCRFTTKSLINEHKVRVMNDQPTPLQKPGARGIVDDASPLQTYFNLKDQVGGYRHEFMMEQRKGCPVIQPMVEPNLAVLSSSVDPRTGRVIIDQSALVYEPLIDHASAWVKPGSSVKDFLLRSKKMISPVRLQQLLVDQKGVHLRKVVRAFLLRHQTTDPVIRRIFGVDDSIDSLVCEKYSRNPNLPPKLTFICAQLTDVILHLNATDPDKYLPMRHIPWADLEAHDACWSAVCTDVMLDRSLPNHMQNAAFFSPLADLSVPILQLITKCCVNVRCQSRTFSSMVRQWLISLKKTRRKRRKARHPQVEETLVETYVLRVCKEMVCCGLLGNLLQSHAASRPASHVRSFIYQLLTQDVYNRWWCRLFERSTSVLVYCVRSYMIWTLDHTPALLRHVYKDDMMSYPRFRETTETAMDALRVCFAEQVMIPVSPLHDCLRTLPSTPCSAVHLFYCGHKKCHTPGLCNLKTSAGHKPSIRPDIFRLDVDPGVHRDKRQERQPQRNYSEEEVVLVPAEMDEPGHEIRPTHSSEEHGRNSNESNCEEHTRRNGRGATHREDTGVGVMIRRENEDMKNERLSGWQWTEHEFHKQINAALNPFDLIIKEISYRRPAIVGCKVLRPMRGMFPLVPYQRIVQPQTQASASVLEDSSDDGEEEEEEEKETRETKEERAIDRYLFPDHKSSPYVPDNHLYAARAIVAHCGPVGHGNPFYRVLKFFPCFGVPPDVVAEIKRLFVAYERRTQPGQPIQRELWKLRNSNPHAYNLIHIFSELLEQAQRRMHMVELPMHILKSQIEGLQQSHEVLNDKVLLDRSISFTFCHVCMHIYSNIRDSNSVYKNAFNLGLLDASHSYLQNKDYCSHRHNNHRGTCGQQELVRIPLLGRMLWFRQKMIMICPQPHCGQMMALDPKEETYVYQNERGPSCIVCSSAVGVNGDQQFAKHLRDTHTTQEIRCVHCTWPNQKIKDNWRARMYGAGRYLCHNHHNPEMDQRIEQELKALPREAHDRCIDRILTIYEPEPADPQPTNSKETKKTAAQRKSKALKTKRDELLAQARRLNWYEPRDVENQVVDGGQEVQSIEWE